MMVGLAPLMSEMVADQTDLPGMNSANSDNSRIEPGKRMPDFGLKMLAMVVLMLLLKVVVFLFDRSMLWFEVVVLESLLWFMFGLKIFLTKWPKIAKSLGPAQFWAFGMTCLAPMFLA